MSIYSNIGRIKFDLQSAGDGFVVQITKFDENFNLVSSETLDEVHYGDEAIDALEEQAAIAQENLNEAIEMELDGAEGVEIVIERPVFG